MTMRVRLEKEPVGMYTVTGVHRNGRPVRREGELACSLAVQTDLDQVGLARSLGFVPCRTCWHTDGTVPCEHYTVYQMIERVQAWLDRRVGRTFPDPGYFDE
jgi:hypothetical protein